MFFLATPHRGSDSAQLLSNLLCLSHGIKPYLTELMRKNSSTEAINDSFRHHAHKLQIRSFYETLPTPLGIGSNLIVDKTSAVLGYSNEQADYLHANHRTICKYDTPSDTNFIKFRKSLLSTVDEITDIVALFRDCFVLLSSRRPPPGVLLPSLRPTKPIRLGMGPRALTTYYQGFRIKQIFTESKCTA